MKQALGLVEISGLSTAVVVADTMAKAANIRILEIENTKGLGYMTIKIEGDVGAVKAAVDAGSQVGRINGKLVSCKVIARPSDYVAATFCNCEPPKPPTSPDPPKPEKETAEESVEPEEVKPEAEETQPEEVNPETAELQPEEVKPEAAEIQPEEVKPETAEIQPEEVKSESAEIQPESAVKKTTKKAGSPKRKG